MITGSKQWLNSEPYESEIADAPNGGKHLPIKPLLDLLDEVSFSTQNYKFELYKNGSDLCVAASLELELVIEGNSRTFIGACNFSLRSILPIEDFNATAKSMCIKNAAADAGRRFGRHLNDNLEVLPSKTESPATIKRTKPDERIWKQFHEAIEKGDHAAISLFKNVYDLGEA